MSKKITVVVFVLAGLITLSYFVRTEENDPIGQKSPGKKELIEKEEELPPASKEDDEKEESRRPSEKDEEEKDENGKEEKGQPIFIELEKPPFIK